MKKTNHYFPITLLDNLPPTLWVILFLLLLTSVPLWGQGWNTWSDPVSITDSISDNKNATVKFLSFTENNFYVFWEKSTDTLSTAIYYKNFYNGDEPHIFLSDEGVHYTHPQPISMWGYLQDTSFCLFYESDESGINRIYYRVYGTDGFTEPKLLTTSPDQQSCLAVSEWGRIIWMEQNRLMYSTLDIWTFSFDDPVVIDSGNCSSPTVIQTDVNSWYDYPVIAWVKTENDSSKIRVRKYDPDEGWLEPETIFAGVQCKNLSFSNGVGSPGILSWDYFNDTTWQSILFDLEESRLYVSKFNQNYPYQPVFFSGYIPVKYRSLEAGFRSIVYHKNDTVDIYTSNEYFWDNQPIGSYQNVSLTENPVDHPQFFMGKAVGCNLYIINLWEEEANNYRQLKYSTTSVCLSSIEEDLLADVSLQTSPNPFREEVTVSFSLSRQSDVRLSVFDVSGSEITILANKMLAMGEHQYKWNGNRYQPGIYYVVLRSNYGITTKKIILSK